LYLISLNFAAKIVKSNIANIKNENNNIKWHCTGSVPLYAFCFSENTIANQSKNYKNYFTFNEGIYPLVF